MTVFQSDSVGFDGGWVTYDKRVRRLNGVGGLRGFPRCGFSVRLMQPRSVYGAFVHALVEQVLVH